MTISNLEEKTYPTVIVANVAQRIMADQVIAWYGEDNIEKIVPGNEIFVEVHFKDGSIRSYYCGMYQPELMERDEDPDHDRRIESYFRHRFLCEDGTNGEEKEEDEQIEKPEVTKHRGRGR